MDLRMSLRVRTRIRAMASAPTGRRVRALLSAPAFPHPDVHEKRATVLRYGKRYRTPILVETGTQLGGTVAAAVGHFKTIYSIEISSELHERALERFRDEPSVNLVHGDSAEELRAILPRLDEPATFWLDAHFTHGDPSGRGPVDCPVLDELDAILALREPRHVVLIDDARSFGVEPGWPPLDEIFRRVRDSGLPMTCELDREIVRIHRA